VPRRGSIDAVLRTGRPPLVRRDHKLHWLVVSVLYRVSAAYRLDQRGFKRAGYRDSGDAFLTFRVFRKLRISTIILRICIQIHSFQHVAVIVQTLYRRRCAEGDPTDDSTCPDEPLVLVPESFLFDFWTTIYWTSFVLTWAVIPLMTSYVRSGRFSALEKLKESVKDNLIYYAVAGAVGIGFVVYISIAKGLSGCVWVNGCKDLPCS